MTATVETTPMSLEAWNRRVWLDQLGRGTAPQHRGLDRQFMQGENDCARAAMASVLGIPIDDLSADKDTEQLDQYLRARGLRVRVWKRGQLPLHRERWYASVAVCAPGLNNRLLANRRTKEHYKTHALVMSGDRLYHDPLPYHSPDHVRLIGEAVDIIGRLNGHAPETSRIYIPGALTIEPIARRDNLDFSAIYTRANGHLVWGDSTNDPAKFGVLATQGYADLLAQGVKFKETARAATTANLTLQNLQTVDGVSLAAGERVLVKDQTNQTQNGIYTVVAGGAWTRTDDANTGTELESATLDVREGTANANTSWRQTTTAVALGSSNIVWTERAALTTAGDGLDRTGNTVSVGEGDGSVEVLADSVQVADGGITAAKIGILPAARVTHNADQTIADSTLTVLAFNAEEFDLADLHDTATNNSRLTAPIAGIYAIGGNHEWNVNAAGWREVQILKNGTTILDRDFRNPVTTAGVRTTHPISIQASLAANDYVEVRVRQTSGGNLITRTTTGFPNFYMHFLGAAS